MACNPVNGRRGPHTVGLPLPGAVVRATGAGLEVAAPNIVPPGLLAQPAGRMDGEGFVDVDHGAGGRRTA
ncbi:MAG: hypothetical protein U0470_03370 [Anaerolineae bacterium]